MHRFLKVCLHGIMGSNKCEPPPPHCKNNGRGGGPPTGMESINYGLLSVDYHLAFMCLNTNKNQKY